LAEQVGARFAKTVETELAAVREGLPHLDRTVLAMAMRHSSASRGPPWSLGSSGRVACLQSRQPT